MKSLKNDKADHSATSDKDGFLSLFKSRRKTNNGSFTLFIEHISEPFVRRVWENRRNHIFSRIRHKLLSWCHNKSRLPAGNDPFWNTEQVKEVGSNTYLFYVSKRRRRLLPRLFKKRWQTSFQWGVLFFYCINVVLKLPARDPTSTGSFFQTTVYFHFSQSPIKVSITVQKLVL